MPLPLQFRYLFTCHTPAAEVLTAVSVALRLYLPVLVYRQHHAMRMWTKTTQVTPTAHQRPTPAAEEGSRCPRHCS